MKKDKKTWRFPSSHMPMPKERDYTCSGEEIGSIEINKGRFELSEQLCDIMRNTVVRLGYDK